MTKIGLSDHEMIFCTRKIKKEKVGGHKKISFRSFKNYSANEYKNVEIVNNIAPLKTARIRNTSSQWFDKEIAEKISIRDKLFYKIQIKPSQHRLQRDKK